MVAPIYTNRKGIYKDLYREIDANNKRRLEKESFQSKKPNKGIYVALYRQLEDDKQKLALKNNERKNSPNNLYILAFKKFINDVSSKVSYFLSSTTGEVKMLIVALIVAKKPINSYIENNWDIQQNSIQ